MSTFEIWLRVFLTILGMAGFIALGTVLIVGVVNIVDRVIDRVSGNFEKIPNPVEPPELEHIRVIHDEFYPSSRVLGFSEEQHQRMTDRNIIKVAEEFHRDPS